MKTYGERTEDVLLKIRKIKRTRRIVSCAVAASLVLVLTLALFLPFGTQMSGVRQYADSPYYELIQKLNAYRYDPPKGGNLLDMLFGASGDGSMREGNLLTEAPGASLDTPGQDQ